MKKSKKILSKKLCYHYTILEKENKKLKYDILILKDKIKKMVDQNIKILTSEILKTQNK